MGRGVAPRRRSWRRPVLAGSIAVFMALAGVSVLGVACGDDERAATPLDGASDGVAETRTKGKKDIGAPLEDPFAEWVDYSAYPSCRFRMPPSAALLPPPIRWEPCPAEWGKLSCRRMVVDWPAPETGIRVRGQAPDPLAIPGRGDRVTLSITHDFDDGRRLSFIGEADGPMLFAILAAPDDCALLPDPSDSDFYAFSVVDSQKGPPGGVIAGDVRELTPRIARKYADGEYHYPVASKLGLVEHDGTLVSWEDGGVADAGTVLLGTQFAVGDALFGRPYITTRAYSPASGTVDLISHGDGGRVGASLGADRTHIAWMEGDQSSTGVSNVAAYVSPFTLNPNAIEHRVLRTDFTKYGFDDRFIVGCGYGARTGYLAGAGGDPEGGLMILRFSDGAAWLLPENNFKAIAMTCTEIFVRVYEHEDGDVRPTVARVRIDSLGPPRSAK
jgi:hypothetical protein